VDKDCLIYYSSSSIASFKLFKELKFLSFLYLLIRSSISHLGLRTSLLLGLMNPGVVGGTMNPGVVGGTMNPGGVIVGGRGLKLGERGRLWTWWLRLEM